MDVHMDNFNQLDIPDMENHPSSSSMQSPKFRHIRSCPIAQDWIKFTHDYVKRKLPNCNPIEETAQCLHLSHTTVRTFLNVPITTIKETRKRKRPKTEDTPEATKLQIRDEIYMMYSEGTSLTVSILLERLKAKEIYHGARTSLGILLKQIGFIYRKDDPRRALMEKPQIQKMRRDFLEQYLKNEEKGENKFEPVFIDETWIFQNGTHRRSWQDDSTRSVRKISGEGFRYIVLNAGNENGFVEDAMLIFKSKSKTGDYHGEMNSENFEAWLKDFLPKLETPSLIVLDNASYHSRQLQKWPTKGWNKDAMKAWLKEKYINFGEDATKDTLWSLISRVPKPAKCFVVDELIESSGHKVLRLPPYHCHFNPIEMVWSQAKRNYDQLILQVKEPIEAWKKALGTVTKQNWANYVEHTNNIIKKQWEIEKKIRVPLQPLIIHVGESDSDSSE